MTQLSVIVCTHNPRPDYLARCIDGIKAQTLPTQSWEVLVIDNASDPQRAPNPDLSWHTQARTVRESTLGLTPARLRGIRESRGDLLVFVDDDNVLDADFLERALEIARDRPFLGAWSGQCRGAFETPPPAWTRRYWGSLVVREFDQDKWSNLPRLADTMPCGAGLVVRRDVARHYLALHETGQREWQLDRTGDSLVSGGDNDLAASACDLGLGVGLIAGLKLTHQIPPERVTLGYLARLAEGIHYSGAILDAYRGVPSVRPSAARRVLSRIRRLFLAREHAVIAAAVDRGRARAWRLIDDAARQANHRDR